ncbi:tyrosine-type recombinase/integrase [Lysinibacillus sp. Ag94]|uniref:tyrosine-type recombinase/integrase n=1 Tax=Lysinibacillus sp. Ag94 TaxID=2936682 RepID=UPI00200FBBBB|nr:tyrosine-type recombinase/integrase [Lysinibacillus sp. Ag94]UPW84007.1 tyrosine-type recombinase/integrase [Lysinibacillus sp. Ag94]
MDIEVLKVPIDDNRIIYVLLDADRKPIEVVAKYMKYLYNSGKTPNTLKGYCQALKAYFTYLGQLGIDYHQVSFEVLSNFVGWLSNPYESVKVTPQKKTSAKRAKSTVNNYITVVTNFYDYLYRSDLIDSNIGDKLMKKVYSGAGGKGYKSFLEHVSGNQPYSKNILKQKEPSKKVEIFTKEQVEIVYNATTNIRDRFLIRLLFETGMRIGEALSLFLEDLKFDNKHRKHQIYLTERGLLPNGGYLKTGERKIDVSQELMDLYDDYLYEVIDDLDLDHNFVFVKLHGDNLGSPMEYHNVRDVCQELKKKTGFHITPHMFRHTHGTLYYLATKNIKMVQERLGHSQIQTTIKYYLHPSEDDIRKDWEKAAPTFNLGSIKIRENGKEDPVLSGVSDEAFQF